MANHSPKHHTIKMNTIIGLGASIDRNPIEVIEVSQIEAIEPPIGANPYCSLIWLVLTLVNHSLNQMRMS